MNILCLNTAFIQADMAVNINGEKTFKKFDSSCKHSECVMLGIDELLKGTKVQNLDYMAVVVGTGSFTGIRIGIAVADGFKTANENLKLVEINSFELAVNELEFLPTKKYAVVFNALSGRYFVQYFEGKNAVSEPLLLEESEIEDVKRIGIKDENLSVCDEYVEFKPQNLLKLAQEKIDNNMLVDILTPLYVRTSQAEEYMAKKN